MSKLELSQIISIINKNKYDIENFPNYTFEPQKKVYNLKLKDINFTNTNNSETLTYTQDNKTNLNNVILERYKLTNEYYIYGIDKYDSFIRSVLYIIDNNLLNYSKPDVDKYITILKNKMGLELEKKKYYQIYNYRKHKYKKADMKDILLNNRKVDDSIKHYIADYFKINIIIINSKLHTNYRIVNDYSNIRGNCYLIEFDNNIYQPILNNNSSIQYSKNINY